MPQFENKYTLPGILFDQPASVISFDMSTSTRPGNRGV